MLPQNPLEIRPGDEAKEASHAQVLKQTARDIITQIREWTGAKVLTAKKRWVFELLQNAIDTARARETSAVKIEIAVSDEALIFRHNGGYFTLDEIDAVIYGGSSKPYEAGSDYIGRFGTGFLVSHVVSRKVKISGVVRVTNGTLCSIAFDLSRESNRVDQISDNISNSFSQLNKVISFPDANVDHWTEFKYTILDEQGWEAIRTGLRELEVNLPFIFAFNDIAEISINNTKYKKEECILTSNDRVIWVGTDQVYLNQNQEMSVDIAILIRDNQIVSLNGRPKIFVAMPLTESADYIHIPFVINSRHFAPTKERDALSADQSVSEENSPSDFQINELILDEAFVLYLELVKKLASSNEYKHLFYLAQFCLINKERTEQNKLWTTFNTLVENFSKQIVEEIPLVDTLKGRMTLRQTVFPTPKIDDHKVLSEDLFNQFYDLVAQVKQSLPNKATVKVWTTLAEALNDEFSSQADLNVYGPLDLQDELRQIVSATDTFPDFDDFQDRLDLSEGEQFLLGFFELANALYEATVVSVEFIENLLPNQGGIIGSRDRRWGDTQISFKLHLEDAEEPIPERLKDIAEQIGRDVRDELVAKAFTNFEIVQKYINDTLVTENILDTLIKDDHYKLPDRVENWEDKTIQGWVELFRWCVMHQKLLSNFRIITKEGKTQEIGDLEEHQFLVPFKYIGINEEFENIYPENKILHKKYFENLDAEDRSKFQSGLRQYKPFIVNLPIYQQEISLDHSKLARISLGTEEVSKVRHKIKIDSSAFSILPFWDSVIGKMQNDRQLSRLFFNFLVNYLIVTDDSWQKEILVNCECRAEKTHYVVPSDWLARVRATAWVATERQTEDNKIDIISLEANKDNLENLLSSQELEELIRSGNEKTIKFLTYLGFDDLDLTIKLRASETRKSEAEVRLETSKLVTLIGRLDSAELGELIEKDPDLIQEVIQKTKEKLEQVTVKEDNRIIGENVERIIEAILTENGLDVRPRHVGGDLEIWPDNREGWDSGWVEIPPYIVEIKFTSGSRAHLSRAQSETAADKRDKYIVMVVKDATDLRERLKTELDPSNIPPNLIEDVKQHSHIIESLHTRLGEFPDRNEVEPDLHGYWVKRQLWRSMDNIDVWVERVWINSKSSQDGNFSVVTSQSSTGFIDVKAKPQPTSSTIETERLQTAKALQEREKVGRNDPCWCGSGKKYKYCHLQSDQKK